MNDVDDHLLPVQESIRHELPRPHGDCALLIRHFFFNVFVTKFLTTDGTRQILNKNEPGDLRSNAIFFLFQNKKCR